jgi:hypothetical protein
MATREAGDARRADSRAAGGKPTASPGQGGQFFGDVVIEKGAKSGGMAP